MKNRIFIVIILIFSTLIFSNNTIFAQDNAPTYQSLMLLGDQEFQKEEYIKAKTYYQEALRLKKNDATANNKLNKTLQKIREQGEKEEKFYEIIDIADNHYDNNDYQKALTEYNKALKIFPKDSYTLDKIKQINDFLKNEKDKLDTFNKLISSADNFKSQKKYAEALSNYEAALVLYPSHSSANEKYKETKKLKEDYDKSISDFEQLKKEGYELSLRKKYGEALEKYNAALNIFPNDSDIQDIIKTLSIKKETSDKYNASIATADALYLEKSYEKARETYTHALTIIPNDSYSTDMIARIDEILNSAEYISLKKFHSIIEEAKSLEEKGENDAALAKYQSALKENPNDDFTINKINHLTEIINKRDKELELQAQYNALINKGDNAVKNEDLYTALEYYIKAIELIPNPTEAKEKRDDTEKKIKEFEAEMLLQKQKWEEYYTDAIKSAQSFMTQQNYVEAIKEYNIALRYKKEDPIATQGLEEATKLNEMRLNALAAEYNQLISNGDIQFESNNYDKAIEFYTKANALNTGYSYPSKMINKIGNILQANKLEELVSNKTEILSNTSKRFTFNPIDVTTRKNNYLLIKAKNLSEDSFTLYVAYGSKNGRSGSFILRIPNNQETNDYIVRIGSQYKWFSEDNTWIEVTPENGNLEIELMEITKSN